jgi:hypothetical protein
MRRAAPTPLTGMGGIFHSTLDDENGNDYHLHQSTHASH